MTQDAQPVPPAPTVQPAPPEPAAPAPAAPAPAAKPTHRTRDRRLGLTGEVLGVIGMVVCIALIIGLVLARNWLTGTVDQAAAAVDGGLNTAVTVLDTVSSRVGEVETRVTEVNGAANALATDPNPAPALSDALAAKLAPLSEKYVSLRTAYAGIREKIVSVVDRLHLLDSLVPGISIPQGPVDALQTLDTKAQAFDSAVSGLLGTTPGAGAANAFGAAVAKATANVGATLQDVSASLTDMNGQVQDLRSEVKAKADQVNLIITFATMIMIALVAYLLFLNWVLFSSSKHLRAGH